jgi:hypothetical protein
MIGAIMVIRYAWPVAGPMPAARSSRPRPIAVEALTRIAALYGIEKEIRG